MLESFIIIGKVFGIITTIIGGVFAIYKLYYKLIRPKLLQPILDRFDKIDKVYLAVGPNGGTSLYDKVVSLDKKISIADARTQSLNSALGLAEWHSDHEGHTLAVNDIACRLTGRPETDFLGSNWINIIHEEDRAEVVAQWFAAIKDKRTFIMEYRWLDNENKSILVQSIARPIFNSQNKFLGYIGTATVLNIE